MNNEIKNAMINGNFSIKDHRWLLLFQRPFFFSFLCSLNHRTMSEFISFVGMLYGINALCSCSCITFTLAATTHHHLLSCIFCPSASPLPCLKPPGDTNWTTQIFDGQCHKYVPHQLTDSSISPWLWRTHCRHMCMHFLTTTSRHG